MSSSPDTINRDIWFGNDEPEGPTREEELYWECDAEGHLDRFTNLRFEKTICRTCGATLSATPEEMDAARARQYFIDQANGPREEEIVF